MKFDPSLLFDQPPRVLAFGYLCVGVSLVLLGDATAMIGTGMAGDWPLVSSVTGLAFVVISALFLYGATAHQHRRTEDARRELETSNQQLQVLSRVFRHNIRNDLNVI